MGNDSKRKRKGYGDVKEGKERKKQRHGKRRKRSCRKSKRDMELEL